MMTKRIDAGKMIMDGDDVVQVFGPVLGQRFIEKGFKTMVDVYRAPQSDLFRIKGVGRRIVRFIISSRDVNYCPHCGKPK